MDAQRFIAEFGHIANAPGGMARLRELVLHLAASGDLIETSVPVSAMPLLETIWRRKKAHPERKKVVSKQSPVPYGLVKAPTHWAICRLGDLTLTITGGGTPSKNNPAYWGGEIPWASVKDLKDQKYIDSTEDHITDEGLRNSSSNLIPINRIIVCTRMGLGKVVINRVELAINQDLKALELPPEVNPDFFFILYKTRDVKGTGTTVSGIKQDQLLALPAALPPTEEQSRIVAKVDELMALCDKLEAQQKSRRQLQTSLRQSILQAVAAARTTHELKCNWQRLQSSFGCLFSDQEDIQQLRDVVLNLALQGVLLPESNLIPRNDSSVGGLGPLPNGWKWKTLTNLSEYITSGSRGWKAYMTNSGNSFIRSQDIRQDALIFDSPAFVTLPDRVEGKRTLVRQGDLLLTITGGNVGRCAVVPELPNDAYVSQHVALIRLREPKLSKFIHFWMINAFGGRAFLARYIYGDKPGLNLPQVGSVPIPVPPESILSEILEDLHKYQKLCDELEKRLGAKLNLSAKFSAATISNLTGIAIAPTQDAPMKAPKTELSAPLRSGKKPSVKDQAPLAAILTRQQGGLNAKDLWQRYGGEIDAFYAQLKTEVTNGWIQEPEPAVMNEIFESASA